MSSQHNQRIIERAKEMWTEEGLSPQQIIDQLSYERDEGLLNVPKGTAVPADKSSINRWANKWKWEPHWKEVKEAKNQPAQQEEMSVVAQVLYHLAENRGFLLAHEYAYAADFRSQPTEAVLMAIQMDLAKEYNPPPVVFRTLRPKLRARIRQEKNASREMEGDAIITDEELRYAKQLMAQRRVQGLPIDEDHAGLDIVYTHQDGNEEVDED